MDSELLVRVDYNVGRKDPAQIFEAMALYINAQRDFCQLLANSLDLDTDFEFRLNAVKEGSIVTRLDSLCKAIDGCMQNAFYHSGKNLFENLVDIDVTETEEQVDQIASSLEDKLAAMVPDTLVHPDIDRQGLAFVLKKMSDANKKMQSGETVSISAGEADGYMALNTEWNFVGDPRKMFSGTTEFFDGRDKLYATVQVNEGNSVWTFRSPATQRRFPARIIDKDWLGRYQGGLIKAIGPLDMIEADLSYSIYTPPDGKGKVEIRNAKIKSILNIHRNGDYQHAFSI